MVPLPVDVARNGAADGDEAGAGSDRHEESAWHDLAQQGVEADPRIHVGDGGLGVEADRLLPRLQLDDDAAAVLAGSP